MSSYCDLETQNSIQRILNANKILLLTSIGCPACVDAKKLLDKNNFAFHSIDISKEENEKYFHCIYDITKSHYVPQVFINNKYIGGYRELTYLNQSKILDDLYYNMKEKDN